MAVVWLLGAGGCAGTPYASLVLKRAAKLSHARLDSFGRALVEVDKLYACYQRAALHGGTCHGQPVSVQAWRQHSFKWAELRDKLGTAYKTLLGAELAVQRWQLGDKRPWNAVQPCVAAAMHDVRHALEVLARLPELNLRVPPALAEVPAAGCPCRVCGDDYYPYENAAPQTPHCEAAISCL